MPNNVADLDDRILDRVDNNALLYPQSERLIYINEAQKIINLLGGFLQVGSTITSQSGRTWYDTPAPILIPLKVQFDDRFLHKSSITRKGQVNPTWTQETTALVGYPVASWIPLGLTKFAIHPADSQGGSAILVTGIRDPALLVNSSDTIPFPNEYLEAMEDLTAFSIQLKEGMPILMAAQMLYAKFVAKMGEQKRWRNFSQPALFVQRRSPK